MQASQSAIKEYSGKASEMMGAKKTGTETTGTTSPSVKKEDFPAPPTAAPVHDGAADEVSVKQEEKEPLLA